MSTRAFLVFPHQLFEELILQPIHTVFYLLEDTLRTILFTNRKLYFIALR